MKMLVEQKLKFISKMEENVTKSNQIELEKLKESV